jgi:Pyruvate/2-oxoacid:ferredoxin oxidoreductase delta subunit
MSIRKVVKIDEAKCNGCGACVPSCAEGAIQVIGGKARLVSDVYCDGLGACLGECPQGAITIEEREAAGFDEAQAHEHVARLKQATRPAPAPAPQPGCPGSMARTLRPAAVPHGGGCPGTLARLREGDAPAEPRESGGCCGAEASPTPSELANWPLQLHLVPPTAPYLQGADLLFAADCVGFALPDFHARLLRGKQLVIACPKLDDTNAYLEKLTELFQRNGVRSVEVAHMEVPCCFGLRRLVETALAQAGVDVPLTVTKVGIGGDILERTEPRPRAAVPTR